MSADAENGPSASRWLMTRASLRYGNRHISDINRKMQRRVRRRPRPRTFEISPRMRWLSSSGWSGMKSPFPGSTACRGPAWRPTQFPQPAAGDRPIRAESANNPSDHQPSQECNVHRGAGSISQVTPRPAVQMRSAPALATEPSRSDWSPPSEGRQTARSTVRMFALVQSIQTILSARGTLRRLVTRPATPVRTPKELDPRLLDGPLARDAADGRWNVRISCSGPFRPACRHQTTYPARYFGRVRNAFPSSAPGPVNRPFTASTASFRPAR